MGKRSGHRHKKAKAKDERLARFFQEESESNSEYEEKNNMTIHRQQHTIFTDKPAKKHASKVTTLEDWDELGESPATTRHVQKKAPRPRKKTIHEKILASLETAAAYLGGVGGQEDVQLWLEHHGFAQSDKLAKLQESCASISKLLQKPANNKITLMCDMESNTAEPFYVYREGSKSVQLLAPIAIMLCNPRYGSRKTFGCVMRTGSKTAMKYAISGYMESLKEHPNLLNSETWTEEVKKLANQIGIRFRGDGFDKLHGKSEGSGYASHVEPKLMTWWTFSLLRIVAGQSPSIGKLHKLRATNIEKSIDIYLSEKPCDICYLFAKELEEASGIKTDFIPIPNVGNLVPHRNAQGYKLWPTKIVVSPEMMGEDGFREQEDRLEETFVQRRNPKIEVVIQNSQQKKSKSTPSRSNQEKEKSPAAVISTFTKSSITTQTALIRKYTYHEARHKSKNTIDLTYDSDESEWQPGNRPGKSKHATPTNKKIIHHGLPTPEEESLFPADLLNKAQIIKNKYRKRHRDMDELSPTPSKKSRHTKFT